MRVARAPLLVPLLAACQGAGTLEVVDPDSGGGVLPATGSSTPTATPGGGGACGAITHWAVVVTGQVLDGSGAPASFADVWVEDRGWAPTTEVIGMDVANAEGFYAIEIADLVSAEDCWGTVLDYVVVGQQGPIYGERAINTPLFNAIQDGSLAADLAPLELL